MDLGEPFRRGMRIKPGEDGSFVVQVGEAIDHGRTPAPFFGFTTVDDLLIWMAKHAARARVTELSECDVLSPEVRRYAEMGLAAAEDILKSPQGSAGLGALRRTTAAEIIRERETKSAALDAALDVIIPAKAAEQAPVPKSTWSA